jgi:hypothetical protein
MEQVKNLKVLVEDYILMKILKIPYILNIELYQMLEALSTFKSKTYARHADFEFNRAKIVSST